MSGGLPTPYTSGLPNTGGMTPPYIGKGKGRAVDLLTPTPMGFDRPMPTSSDTEKWRNTLNGRPQKPGSSTAIVSTKAAAISANI